MTGRTRPSTTTGHHAPGARLGRALLLAVAVLVLLPSAALADPPRPTSYRSTVTSLDAAAEGLEVAVLGGDAFLELRAPAGREVVVLGYGDGAVDPEPYLRFPAAGGVEVNTSSPAHHLNQDRYALEPVPGTASASATPTWERLSDGRTWSWHDHRVHWMSPQPPPQVATDAAAAQPVLDWSVPLLVDGEPGEVAGSLVWLPPRSPALPTVVVVAAAAAAALLVRRSSAGEALRPAGAVVAAGSALALVAVAATLLAPGAEPVASLPTVVVPAVALVLALAAASGRATRGLPTLLLAALALAAHVALGADALVLPVLPGLLPTATAWLLPAVALGLALGAGGALLLPHAHGAAPRGTAQVT